MVVRTKYFLSGIKKARDGVSVYRFSGPPFKSRIQVAVITCKRNLDAFSFIFCHALELCAALHMWL